MTISMHVDETICQGHGLCQRAAPEVFELRDDLEHAVVLLKVVPAELVDSARRALDSCPERAIYEATAPLDQ